MKISHNTRGWNPDRTDPAWAERVEREAAQVTNATERAYLKAQGRLARAEDRVAAERTRKKPDRKLVRRLEAAVEARRTELRELHRLLNGTPAGSQNRGTRSHRGVARGEVL